MQLATPPNIDLTVDTDEAVGDKGLRLCPRLDEARKLEKLSESDRLVTDWDINCVSHVSIFTYAAENRRSRKLLVTTNTDENAIAAPASIGLSRPAAASGIAATL